MEGATGDITVPSANRKCSAITGSARKIRDGAADWHNLLLRWEGLNQDGFMAAANIVNLRRSQSDESSSAASLQVGGATRLQDECIKLQEVVDKMGVIVTKMERLMTSQQGIQDLEEFQFGPEGRMTPLFHSWTTSQFAAASGVLLQAFSQELRLKQTILREVAHTMPADLSLVYLSCWVHQPFIPTRTRLTLEALLLETGHRPL